MTDRNKAILLILLSAFASASMGLLVNLAGDLPSMQKSFFRNFIACIFAFCIQLRSGEGFRVERSCVRLLSVRCLAGTLGLMASFYSMDRLPLADWTMIGKMAPFFTLLFSAIILGEKVDAFRKVCLVVAAVGSMFIVKPSFSNILLFPSVLCLCDAILSGVAYTLVRKLGIAGVSGSLIVFYFSLSSSIATLPFAIFGYKEMSAMQFFLLFAAAACGFATQILLTVAYRLAPSKDISIFEYSQIVFAAFLGYVFLSQVPDSSSIAGYAIIILAASMLFLCDKERRLEK